MYNVALEPPRQPGVCEKCGGELYQREDDSEQTVQHRLDVYGANTKPLLEYYSQAGILSRIDAIGTPEDVERRMIAALDGLVPGERG
jgi:adenylate kinase